MSKRKILFPINSRGNYAKLKNIILNLQDDPDVQCIITLGGSANISKYGNLTEDLRKNGVMVDEEVNFVMEGENLVSMSKSSGLAALEFTSAMHRLDPDIVIIVADRFECLPIAMCARYLNKCIVHLEGGEITGSVDDSIRHAISKLANYHFVCSDQAREVLLSQGERERDIFVTGSTSYDEFVISDIDRLATITEYQHSAGTGEILRLEPGNYGVCIFHPVTTEYEANYTNCKALIDAIKDDPMEYVWIWPNMDAGSDGVSKAIRVDREGTGFERVHFFKSLPIELYAPLLKFSKLIVGNSSSGIREAGFVGVPSVCVGSRQSSRQRDSNVISVDADTPAIKAAIAEAKTKKLVGESMIYSQENASQIAARHLRSIDIVRSKFLYE